MAQLTRPAPTPPTPKPRGLRALFIIKRAPRQWPVALRTCICVVVPVAVGWLAGDLPAGLLAGLGGFASLYGSGRPYRNRARLLGVIAVAQALAVVIGVWASVLPWAGVLAVAAIAVVATALCNAYSIQPGAYQIALTCATGTAIHVRGRDAVETGLLVLAGGLFAAVVHLSSALVDRYGPERHAVASGAAAVADFLDAIDTPDADQRRHEASVAMHHAWVVLVNQQPYRAKPPEALLRLRETSRALQLILADAMRRNVPDPIAAARVRRLGRVARRGSWTTASGQVLYGLPLGRPSAFAMVRNTIAPGSRSLLVIIRVAVAALAAGAIGAAVGLNHTYWAIAATVLILSQGFDQRQTAQRGLERTAGTIVGLGLAALALAVQPTGWLLIGMLAVIVYCGQLLVPRNYAAAAIFITGSAMLMAGGNLSLAAAAALLRDRGLDTALGCLVAVVVFGLLSKKSPSGWLPTALSDTLTAAAAAVDQFTPDTVISWPGLTARRDLQRRVIRLSEAYENGVNGFPRQRAESERVWPVVVAVERLAHRVLAEGWRLEEATRSAPVVVRPTPVEPPPSEGLRVLAESIRQARPPGRTDAVPSFLSRDVGDLRRVLQR